MEGHFRLSVSNNKLLMHALSTKPLKYQPKEVIVSIVKSNNLQSSFHLFFQFEELNEAFLHLSIRDHSKDHFSYRLSTFLDVVYDRNGLHYRIPVIPYISETALSFPFVRFCTGELKGHSYKGHSYDQYLSSDVNSLDYVIKLSDFDASKVERNLMEMYTTIRDFRYLDTGRTYVKLQNQGGFELVKSANTTARCESIIGHVDLQDDFEFYQALYMAENRYIKDCGIALEIIRN